MDSTDAPQIIEHTTRSLNFTPFETRWVPCSARFVLLGQTPSAKGILQVFQLDQKEDSKLKLLKEFTRGSGYKCATFGASSLSERNIAVGDFSGNLAIIDLETTQEVFTVKAHETIINSIDGAGSTGYGPPELITGGRDGAVKVWDPRQTAPVVVLEPVEQIKPECWALGFGNSYNDTERVLAAGYDNGDIKLFDLRTNYLQWDHNVRNGVVALQFDRRDAMMNKLGAATLEGNCHVFDLRTFNAAQGGYSYVTDKPYTATVWGIRHTPQNRDLFVTLGGNGSVNLYKYNYPSQRSIQDENGNPVGVPGTLTLLNQREISTQPIASFDWNGEKMGLAVGACLDQTLKVILVTKLNLY
jgi:WD40 repeat protein